MRVKKPYQSPNQQAAEHTKMIGYTPIKQLPRLGVIFFNQAALKLRGTLFHILEEVGHQLFQVAWFFSLLLR